MIIFGLLSIGISSLLAYIFACVFGSLQIWISVLSLALGFILSAVWVRKTRADWLDLKVFSWRPGPMGILERLIFIVVLLITYHHFMYILYQVDSEWRTLHPNNIGDLPLHLNYFRSFANGISFPPHNPIYASELLRYPFAIDLYNGLWEQLGVNTQAHLFLVGMFCTIAALVVLRRVGSWIGMVGFFLSGGYHSGPAGDFIERQSLLAWKNLFISVFLTQRGFLWALPVGVLLIYEFIFKVRGQQSNLSRAGFSLLLFLFGMMSFFHLHTFFILFIILAGVWGYRNIIHARELPIAKAFEYFKTHLPAFVTAFAIALYFILFSTNFLKAGGVSHWHSGWTYDGQEPFVKYIMSNFGPYLVLMIGALIIIFLAKQKQYYFEALFYLGLFVLFFNFILAPWDWDNIKILIWPYLCLLFLSFEVIEDQATLPRQIAILFCLSFGGIVSISATQFSMTKQIHLFQTAALAKTEGAVKGVPADAVFAAAPTYDHELSALGRIRAVGWDGHLWSHGIVNPGVAKAKLEGLLGGGDDWLSLAKELGVTHILWGPKERAEIKTQKDPAWRSKLKNISPVPDYEVYEVKAE